MRDTAALARRRLVTPSEELLDAFIGRDGVQNVLGTAAATASSKLTSVEKISKAIV